MVKGFDSDEESNERGINEGDASKFQPGFDIQLPFGFGYIRGDGDNVDALVPVLKWCLIMVTVVYLLGRVLRETTGA